MTDAIARQPLSPAPGELPAAFFSCDWGTTNFRLRLTTADGETCLAEVRNDRGSRRLASEAPAGPARAAAYATVLRDAVGHLRDQIATDATRVAAPFDITALDFATLPILISGMAGSSIGWLEVPYAATPFRLDASGLGHRAVHAAGLGPIRLLSGVAAADDVMRGEETELLGLLAAPAHRPLASGCRVIMPGTHNKHVRIEAGHIVDLHTAMTGELYDVLRRHSVLAAVLAADPEPTFDHPDLLLGFDAGLHEAGEQGLMRLLFRPRVRALLRGWSPARCSGFLSGALIAADLLDLAENRDLDTPVLLAAGGDMAARYARAWHALGLPATDLRLPVGDAMAKSVMRGQALYLRAIAPDLAAGTAAPRA